MRHRAFFSTLGFVLVAACGGEVFVGGTGGSGAGASGGTGPGGSGAGGHDFTACDGPAQCVLRPESCCGQCGAATPGDMIGLHQDWVDDYLGAHCATLDCPACFMPQEPDLFAYCHAGHCVAADVRVHELSACNTASDCVVRWGLDCCEGCGLAPPEELVALSWNGLGALGGLVCPADWGCPDCLVQYPPDVTATCTAGHCEVTFLPPPPGG